MNQEKINSLQWAIDELSKQKEEFTSMLEVAQKREETSSLIEEVNAQKDALIKVFNEQNIPFREFKIKTINEEILGKLFSLFIVETIIIGKLLGINPYDQPAVEKVKNYTKQKLS